MDISRKKYFFLTIVIFININRLFSQESLGLTMNNYSGVWGAQINPALLTQGKTYIDANILGSNVNFANNFAYIPKDNPSFFGPFPVDTVKPIYGDFYYNGYYTYYRNTLKKWMTLSMKTIGPSFMFQYNHQAFAITTSLRSALSAENIPWEIPVLVYEDLDYEPLHNIKFTNNNFGLSELLWEEISFSYANEFLHNYDHSLSLGISAKFLIGLGGIYNTYKTADYKVINKDSVYFYTLDSDVGYAINTDAGLNLSLINPKNASGYGFAFDIGFVYTKRKRVVSTTNKKQACAFPYNDYIYKIGVSLLDVGGIKFSKNSGLHNYSAENVKLNVNDLPDFKNKDIEEYLREVSVLLTGDPDSSYQKNNISIGLPSAASLQFDWHINKSYYLSFIWVHPIHFNHKNVRRTAQMTITPRYESRMFGISLPVSLVNYEIFRTGLSLRFYNIVVGTESLGTLLDLRNLDNVNLYFGVKLNLEKGKCNPNKVDACSFGW